MLFKFTVCNYSTSKQAESLTTVSNPQEGLYPLEQYVQQVLDYATPTSREQGLWESTQRYCILDISRKSANNVLAKNFLRVRSSVPIFDMHHTCMHNGYMHHGYMYHGYINHGYMHYGHMHHGHICVGHTAWAPKGGEGRSQGGPKGRRLEVGARRAN